MQRFLPGRHLIESFATVASGWRVYRIKDL